MVSRLMADDHHRRVLCELINHDMPEAIKTEIFRLNAMLVVDLVGLYPATNRLLKPCRSRLVFRMSKMRRVVLDADFRFLSVGGDIESL